MITRTTAASAVATKRAGIGHETRDRRSHRGYRPARPQAGRPRRPRRDGPHAKPGPAVRTGPRGHRRSHRSRSRRPRLRHRRNRRGALRTRTRNNTEFGIASIGTRAIIGAMKATGVRRVVAVSVAGISTIPTPGRPNPPQRDPGHRILPADRAQPDREGQARQALRRRRIDGRTPWHQWPGLDLRPVAATDRQAAGRHLPHAYEQGVRRGLRISSADAAQFILDALQRPETIGHSIAIAY
jgi:NAD(P)H-binding